MFAGNFAPRGGALCDGQLLQISQNSGSEKATLTPDQIPAHRHDLKPTSAEANRPSPANSHLATFKGEADATNPTDDLTLDPDTIPCAGGGLGHDNVQPFPCVNYIIALVGTFPSRN